MTPVMQTQFKPSDDAPADEIGNCLQAAVASLFELELDEVPNFAAAKGPVDHRGAQAWWCALEDFGRKRGYLVLCFAEPIEGLYGIMSGDSPRGNWAHSVVAEGSTMIHDPHPDNTGVLSPSDWIYFIQRDPSDFRGIR